MERTSRIEQGERMIPGNIRAEVGYAVPHGKTIAGWMVLDRMRGVPYDVYERCLFAWDSALGG